MNNCFRLVLFFCVFLVSLQAHTESISVHEKSDRPVGEKIQYFKEGQNGFGISVIRALVKEKKFTQSDDDVLNFGIGSDPVWLYLEVSNPDKEAVLRRLSIETSWLDKLSVYFFHDEKLIQQQQAGDAFEFSERESDNIFFTFDKKFNPGVTQVFIRVETDDPLVLPVYLSSQQSFVSRHSRIDISYGFLYGAILSLLFYNFLLFVRLKTTHHLYFSLYLLAFVVMNMSYSGHAYQWLWPESVIWQQWSNPLLMMMFMLTGLLFATQFLNTKILLPVTHKLIIYTSATFLILQTGAFITGQIAFALLLSFSAVFVFAIVMVMLGAVSFYRGNGSAKYFLIASVSHVVASSITAMAVWGIIPHSELAYRAVDIGMVIDATLLAMALADQFRISQQARLDAEKLARIDPLTGLNNRRAFYEYLIPIWSIAERKNYPMSVIMIDIDRFKQVNDRYGHDMGDRVLVKVSQILEHGARSGDILARWGGEEFILFLPDTDMNEAVTIANRLRESISRTPVNDSDDPLYLTASMGVSYNDSTGLTLNDLIKVADNCLYRAKTKGRDLVCAESMGIC